MKIIYTLFTAVGLFASLASADIPKESGDEIKLNDIISGRSADCSSFRPSLNPTLNFETYGPKVSLNESSSQLSLQMKVIYYRCQPSAEGEATATPVNPKEPYQYTVEQFDGTSSTVKVRNQKFRFSAMLEKQKSSKNISQGLAARVETDNLINLVRFDIPLKRLLTENDQSALNRGKSVDVSVRLLGALATEYRIGEQTQGQTGFRPVNEFQWKVKLSKEKKGLSAEHINLQGSPL